jgi:hypothetical protein
MPALPPAVRALPRVPIKGNMLPKTPALQFERIIHRDRAAGCGLRAHPCLIAVAGGPPLRICDGYGATWSPDGAWLALATAVPNVTTLIKVPLGRPQDAVVIRKASGR